MDKLENLKRILKEYQQVAIAYSGGCDSNFLLQVAINTLGKENVYAICCKGAMMLESDKEDVDKYLQDVPHTIVDIDVFSIKEFANNDVRRCYFCKKNVMSHVIEEAKKHGFTNVVDGTNKDDEGVYRPGLEACQELGIKSPLKEANMTKDDIRHYSKELNIETYAKPANACLASRFNYGEHLTVEKLALVNKAEAFFHEIGINHVRVRVQNNLARIEVDKENFEKVINNKEIVNHLKELGFDFVTLDLEGITSGSYDRVK